MIGAAALQRPGEVDRGLSAELDDRRGQVAAALSAIARFVLEDVADRLLVQRLEVEAVARVEVRRYGLGLSSP